MVSKNGMFVLFLKKGMLLPSRFKEPKAEKKAAEGSDICIWPQYDLNERPLKKEVTETQIFGHYSDIEIRYIQNTHQEQPLIKLWSDTCEQAVYASAHDSHIQPILIFCDKSPKSITDILSKYSYFVISFITINPDIIYPQETSNIQAIITSINKDLHDNLEGIQGDVEVCYSLDCADRILFIGTNNPGLALDRIYSLQTLLGDCFKISKESNIVKRRYSYTYSIIGLNRFINDASDPITLESNDDYPTQIDSISITGIIDYYSSYSVWLEKITSDASKYKVSIKPQVQAGGHDILLHIENVPLLLFKEWTRSKGLLTRDNTLNSEAFSRFSLRMSSYFSDFLNSKVQKIKRDNENRSPSTQDSFSFHKSEYLDKWSNALMALSKSKLGHDPDVIRVLYSLYASMKQAAFSDSTFGLFWSVAPAIDEFIRCINLEVVQNETNIIEIKREIFEFVQLVNNLIESTTHSHRHQFETPDLQAKFYDIYSKLFSIYVGFCHFYKGIFRSIERQSNRSLRNYKFLLSPVLGVKMYVEGIMERPDSDGILLIHAPEKIMFSPEIMIPQLIHEINHPYASIVCNIDALVKTYSTIITTICADILLRDLTENELRISEDLNDDKVKQLFLSFNLSIYTNFWWYMKRKVDSQILQKRSANELDTPQKAEILMTEIFVDIFSSLFYTSFIQFLHNDQIETTGLGVLQSYEKILRRRVISVQYNLEHILNSIYVVIDESVADVIMCATLDLSIDEYSNLYKNISYVDYSELDTRWTQSVHYQEYDIDVLRIITVAHAMWPNDITSNKLYKKAEKVLSDLKASPGDKVVSEITRYLILCREAYKRVLANTDTNERLEDFKKCYQTFCMLNKQEGDLNPEIDFPLSLQSLLSKIISTLRYNEQ